MFTGIQQLEGQATQQSLRIPNQNSLTSTVTSVSGDSGSVSKTTQLPPMSLPYTIYINLTSSGEVKLPPQLQPITTSTTAAVTATKCSQVPPLQPPKQLMLNTVSQSLLSRQQTLESSTSPSLLTQKALSNGLKSSGDIVNDNSSALQMVQSNASSVLGKIPCLMGFFLTNCCLSTHVLPAVILNRGYHCLCHVISRDTFDL